MSGVHSDLPTSSFECQVCCETGVPPSKRAACPFCDFKACKPCLKRFLTEGADDARCMKCSTAYTRQSLLALLSRSWVDKEYRKHRETCLFERETALLPSTQRHVRRETVRRRYGRELREMFVEIEAMRADLATKTLRYRTRESEQERSLRRMDMEMEDADAARVAEGGPSTAVAAFQHRCGREGCKGWLSSKYKCSVCETYTCSRCNCVKENRGGGERQHVCDPEAVASHQLIQRDSRKCPSCAVYIHKIDGCDQMFCTQCLKAFSWRTGKPINSSALHNPHYFEAMSRGILPAGRVAGDVPCGGLPTAYELRVHFSRATAASVDVTYAFKALRLVHHMQQVETARYPTEVDPNVNLPLRVQYCLSDVSEDEFKSRLQRTEKANEKKKEFGEVVQLLINTFSDELRTLLVENREDRRQAMEDAERRLRSLVEYANGAFLSIAQRYKCSHPHVCPDALTFASRRSGAAAAAAACSSG